MKSYSLSSQRKPSTDGVALVVVLAFLVLLAGLIISFFSNAQTEVQAAKVYESGVQAKQLAAAANQLVIGQISDATKSVKQPREPGAPILIAPGERLAWASQPGMIRTWDDSGKPWRAFKLYSSPEMVVDTSREDFKTGASLAKEVPENWEDQTAAYVDLNRPVLVEDPAGDVDYSGRKARAEYPILDARAVQQVDGFRLTPAPGYSGPRSGNEAASPAGHDPTAPGQNPAPMPVAWIYVLKDGTLTAPTGTRDDGATAEWKGAEPRFTPSRRNPIVGRVAFWADDESSKINLNTASEPTPWDTPRAVTIQDLNYGRYQPAKGEYQRFPGHPYSTAISPVLMSKVSGNGNLTKEQKEQLYALLPRVQGGGSQGGTTSVVNHATSGVIQPDGDRLFTNVDEFLFGPGWFGSERKAARDIPAYSKLGLDLEKLRRSRFFLTANSRAPEVNLFGQPRISLWPVSATATQRSTFDKVAAFCTTLNGKTFSFQRSNSASPTVDAQLERNRQLYSWLQKFTSKRVPGFGGSFSDKWENDRDQILTEVFDYIRGVNLNDPQADADSKVVRFAPNGQVTPLEIGDTKGFGRFHTLSQFGFHFIATQQGAEGLFPAKPLGPNERYIQAAFLFEPFSPSLGWYKIAENLTYEVTFTTDLLVEGQSLGMPSTTAQLNNGMGSGWHNNGRERGGTGGLRGPIQAFGGGGYRFAGRNQQVKVGMNNKPTMSFSGGRIRVRLYSGSGVNAANLVQTYDLDFPAGEFPLPDLVKEGTLAYQGGQDRMEQPENQMFKAGATPPGFWWTFQRRYSRLGEVPHAAGPEYADPKRRWAASGGPPGFKVGGMFRREDVVRSIVPDHGDLRLIAAQKEPGGQFVKVSQEHWNSAYRFLHIFSNASGPHFHYGFCNEPGPSPSTQPFDIPGAAADDQLVPSADVRYHYSRLPQIRAGAGKLYNKWNDFDNAVAQWSDGPYINKPDEGNQSATNSVYTYFAWNFDAARASFFSPNRLVPSAGMLGSLPTGVKRHTPVKPRAWETLLFRPQQGHPGEVTPPDHLLMDMFWMPVIEPYAISEPFSTAGKVNMNYEIAPFSYIRRATAMHGAMKSEEPLAVPNSASKIHKLWDHETSDNPHLPDQSQTQDPEVRTEWGKLFRGQKPYDRLRRPLDIDQTLTQFEERFAKGQLFRSATELCEMHLVRDGEQLKDYRSGEFWKGHLVTGDNTRERPYTNLYAKLTTKSNTFTIHVRTQSLRKATSTDEGDWAVWREGRDQQLSEFRGSSIIERFIEAADPTLPDFATAGEGVVDTAYKVRVLATRKFAP